MQRAVRQSCETVRLHGARLPHLVFCLALARHKECRVNMQVLGTPCGVPRRACELIGLHGSLLGLHLALQREER